MFPRLWFGRPSQLICGRRVTSSASLAVPILRARTRMTTDIGSILQRRHLPALDGLRAVLVLLVVLYHAGLPLPGDLGVTGFFVLSGFLITWLLIREHEHSGSISLRGFYLRRSLRIFPAYFLFVGASVAADAVLGGLAGRWAPLDLMAALTYTVNYRNAFLGHDHPIAHAWSLAVEEQFYLVWPLLFMLFHRRVKVVKWLSAAIAAAIVWRAVLYVGFGASSHYIYNAFDTRFDALAIGCLLAYVCQDGQFQRVSAAFAARWYFPLPVILLLYTSRVAFDGHWHYTAGFAADAALIGVLLVQLMQLSDRGPWRWLNSRLAVRLGTISYPIYLWHLLGLGSADNILGGRGGWAAQLVLGLVVTLVLAVSSYNFVEKPFLRLKGRFAGSSRPRHAPAIVPVQVRLE